MKKAITLLIVLLGFASAAYAGNFVSGSTGADGAFNPTTNTVLQLPPNGVFNFTSVNIPAGITVTFAPNAANTPVYILATNDVTIAGNLNINGGSNTNSSFYPGAAGPGGFAGGMGGLQGLSGTAAAGPNGGNGGCYACAGGGQGGGGAGGSISINNNIIPIIGGSGGGGGGGDATSVVGKGGGGGGGGILIASSGTVTITGSITANGGTGGNTSSNVTGCQGAGGGGSGGAIKIMANTIAGNGTIQANGGGGGSASGCIGGCYGGAGSNGLIRLEFNSITRTAGTSPAYTSASPPGIVFYPNIPTLNITSIGGMAVPSSPGGLYNAPDITLPSGTANPVSVGLSATNIPTGTIITLKLIPEFSTSATSVNSTPLSGTFSSSTATANVNLSTNYTNVLFASTTYTLQTAMYYNGEKIDKVMVAAEMGKGSKVTYITESGKKIPAEVLMASLGK